MSKKEIHNLKGLKISDFIATEEEMELQQVEVLNKTRNELREFIRINPENNYGLLHKKHGQLFIRAAIRQRILKETIPGVKLEMVN